MAGFRQSRFDRLEDLLKTGASRGEIT